MSTIQTHTDLNMSTNTNTLQGDNIDRNGTSVSAALSEAHNVIYSVEPEDTVFGSLFDNSITNTKPHKLKRKLNESDSEIEAQVNDKQSDKHESKRAKHQTPYISPALNTLVTEAIVHIDSNLSPDVLMLTQLINKLSIDMRNMFSNVTTRIDNLETSLERKITQKVNQIVDKRINSEVGKVRKEMNSVVENIRSDFDSDIKSVEDKLTEISKKVESTDSSQDKDLSCNVVIRNLPESVNENLKGKVSALMREGLKLNDVSICKVERKQSRSDHSSGIVIATCNSKQNVTDIMSAKQKLKNSRQYSNVFIHKDQTVQQRIERKNLKTIVDVLKSVNPGIDMRGAEIIAHRYINYQSGSKHQGHENRQNGNPSGEHRRNENTRNRQPERRDQSDNRGDNGNRRQQTYRSYGNGGRQDQPRQKRH